VQEIVAILDFLERSFNLNFKIRSPFCPILFIFFFHLEQHKSTAVMGRSTEEQDRFTCLEDLKEQHFPTMTTWTVLDADSSLPTALKLDMITEIHDILKRAAVPVGNAVLR
jgi:hypothetical protein